MSLAGVGAIMSGASSLFGAISGLGAGKRQQKMMREQYRQEEDYQKRMSKWRWDNFNSPLAQRRAMEAAGINPFAGDSSIGGMQVDSNASSPNFQDAANPLGDFASAIQPGAASLFQMGEQRRVNDSTISVNESVARKNNAEASNQEWLNSDEMRKLFTDERVANISNKRLDAAYKEIQNKYAEAKTVADLQVIRASYEKLIADKEATLAQKDVWQRQLDLLDAQIANLGASTRNLDAQTSTENATRGLKTREMVESILNRVENTRSIKRKDARDAIDQINESLGLKGDGMAPTAMFVQATRLLQSYVTDKDNFKAVSARLAKLYEIAYDIKP